RLTCNASSRPRWRGGKFSASSSGKVLRMAIATPVVSCFDSPASQGYARITAKNRQHTFRIAKADAYFQRKESEVTFDPAEPCLVLVCKRPAPGHAKQRLAATLGQQAALQAAQALLACALEDLQQWPGPTAIAPDNLQHLSWSQTLNPHATCVAQGD